MMERNTDGNVFMFSFYTEIREVDFNMQADVKFEAIVNLTEIDEAYVMAKMSDEKLPQSVDSIISMTCLRAQFNEHRRMEVWLAKLDESFDEQYLADLAEADPKAVAMLARQGEHVGGIRPGEARTRIGVQTA